MRGILGNSRNYCKEFEIKPLNVQCFFVVVVTNTKRRTDIPTLSLSYSLSLAFTPSRERHSSPRVMVMMVLIIPLKDDNCPGVVLGEE